MTIGHWQSFIIIGFLVGCGMPQAKVSNNTKQSGSGSEQQEEITEETLYSEDNNSEDSNQNDPNETGEDGTGDNTTEDNTATGDTGSDSGENTTEDNGNTSGDDATNTENNTENNTDESGEEGEEATDENDSTGNQVDEIPVEICTPEVEDCYNNIDDDCDEFIDMEDDDCEEEEEIPEECTWETVNCHSHGIPNCNTHRGDNEAACRAMGNPGGCSEQIFHAWCTRRVDPGPTGLWFLVHQWWIEDRCDGEMHFDNENLYSCTDNTACKNYICETPLVLSFEEDQSVSYHPDDGSAEFNLAAPGKRAAVRTDWPTSVTPWLAYDRDGDGQISSGQELFGSATPMPRGTAKNGFQALIAMDSNGDGILDAEDSSFDQLLLWADSNNDRVSSSKELRSLHDYNILSLELDYQITRSCDSRGNCEVERARFTYRDKLGRLRQGAIIDIHLAIHRDNLL